MYFGFQAVTIRASISSRAAARPRSLIDVKQYSLTNPVQVELVRHVYGVAAAVQHERPERKWHGGIVTSSRFTSGAEEFGDRREFARC